MDLRIPVALLLTGLLAGCQGALVSADGRPIRPFQDSPATAPALAPTNPAADQPASARDTPAADATR